MMLRPQVLLALFQVIQCSICQTWRSQQGRHVSMAARTAEKNSALKGSCCALKLCGVPFWHATKFGRISCKRQLALQLIGHGLPSFCVAFVSDACIPMAPQKQATLRFHAEIAHAENKLCGQDLQWKLQDVRIEKAFSTALVPIPFALVARHAALASSSGVAAF